MRYLFFILIMYSFASVALPCKMSSSMNYPLSRVDSDAYIFIGEVVGYAERIKSGTTDKGEMTKDKFYGEGVGVKIRSLDKINFPSESSNDFELYKFGLTPSCLAKLIDLSYLKVGTKLRIVANKSKLLPQSNTENDIRLETTHNGRLSIISDNEYFVSDESGFDYKKEWKVIKEKLIAEKDFEKLSAFDDFIYLETNKDLIRVEKTLEDNQYEVFERMLYNFKADYSVIIKRKINYLTSDKTSKNVEFISKLKELIKQREELEKSGYFRL
jgi:hypothetical protein